MNPRLLIVDDDEAIRTQLKYALRDDYVLAFAEDRVEAISMLQEFHPAVVSLDLGLPPSPETADEGLKALDEILGLDPTVKVLVVTGNGDRENAYRAVQAGAFDFYLKPIDLGDLKTILKRAAFLQDLEVRSVQHFRAAEEAARFEEILGSTPRMREIFAMVGRVAKTDATVLIQGESGTGKELLAGAIHQNSRRKTASFIPINCGAIPETLIEAELFGHEKGSYTGAHVQRKGKVESAGGGTLFLDEIGELPLPLQVKLLRFLQEREIERIGGRERIPVDVRIIAASNRDLKSEIQAGRFREDLYYRLSVVTITVPPLRERGDDIVLIARAFLARSCQEHRRKVRFSPAALQALLAYTWPGNIRELENKVQRAVIMAQRNVIEPLDLDLAAVEVSDEPEGLRDARDRVERQALLDGLVKHRGNISQASKALGVSRPTFHALLAKHEIDAKNYR
jgi:two-component system, NtrC family, response regulator